MVNIGRNAPCSCGSGKKYKKCCLRKDEEEHLKEMEEQQQRARRDQSDEVYDELFENLDENGEWEEEWESEENEWLSEEDDFGKVQGRWDPELLCPQIDKSLPEISGEDEEIVDRWWKESEPIYLQNDADELMRRIEAFSESHPGLFVHLALDEECLFELGAELARRGEHHRYVQFLQWIRRVHPEVFILNHAYYDRDIITQLILDGRQEEILQYLNYFKEDPDSNTDVLSEVIDILLATNCQKALFDLVRQTAIPVVCSPGLIRGNFALSWYFFEQYIPYLDKRDGSERSCRDLVEALNGMDLPFDPKFQLDQIKKAFAAAFDGVATWEIAGCGNQSDLEEFYDQIGWHFLAWLKHKKRLSWATARFFANRLGFYFIDIPEGTRPKKAFGFERCRLDRHIAQACKTFFSIDGVRAMSLLQSVYDFADYLGENMVFSEEEIHQTRDTCLELFESCNRTLPPTNAGPRVFANFPEYRWAY